MPIDPTVYAAPGFLAAVVIEALVLARWVRNGRAVVGYEKRDTWASLAMGTGSLVFVTLIQVAQYYFACWLWQFRVADLGAGALGVGVALVVWDFAYYWQHRAEHLVRVLWSCHINHHSSRHFNFSTALRQPWTPWTHLLFYSPWALVGVRPELIVFAGGINLIYQFWVHTETVGRLGPLEWVLNTPSHHRVHHGANPQYLDRNYGGILIVWDRMFGTFEPEVEPVRYGLTKDLESFNPLVIAFHDYVALFRQLGVARSFRDRLKLIFTSPARQASR